MKKFLRCVCFLCVFAVLFYFVNTALRLKYPDGIETMENFYDYKSGELDVLFVGSSHVGMNVDPYTLWNEYGMAGYTLWGGMQPVWNSYYFIKEALKTQQPRMIVLETYTTALDEPYSDYSATVKNTMGMRMSMDKIRAVAVSASTTDLAYDILLGVPTYHERVMALERADFENFFWNKKTAIQRFNIENDITYPMENPDWSIVTEKEPLAKKQGEYFQKILDLCRTKGVKLVLLTSPYHAAEQEQRRYNTIAEIAQENGLEYINYNLSYRDAGIDFQTDFRDPGHLNMDGIVKYTKHLGGYLKTLGDIPDRRADASHPWNIAAQESESTLRYRLEEQFIGDGLGSYVDTGLTLYENPFDSWTVLARIDADAANSVDTVYLSCFSEDPAKANYGLLVRKEPNGSLAIRAGNNTMYEIRDAQGVITLGISKSVNGYTIVVNGKVLADDVQLPCDAYNGNLLIGCQETVEGEKFRFSENKVAAVEVYSDTWGKDRLVAWQPELPPMPAGGQMEVNLEYRMDTRFVGDGAIWMDTGIPLYLQPRQDWTLDTQLVPLTGEGDKVYLSCFSEEEDAFRGLLVRGANNGDIEIHVGANYTAVVPYPGEAPVRLSVVKDGFTYWVYVNGTLVIEGEESRCAAYEGTLLVGCQTTADGDFFRMSPVTVDYLEIEPEVLSAQALKQRQPLLPPEPVPPVAQSVEYQLARPFLGDGEANALDTGIQMYDVPEKDWTLLVEMRREARTDMTTVLSCFSEDPKDYHGLLIRQMSDYEFSFVLGKDTVPISVDPDPKLKLAIVKNGNFYKIYAGGVLAAEVESRCAAYDGTLLLGCQIDANGEKFRFGAVKIEGLEAHDGCWTDAQIRDWANSGK